MTSAQEGAAAVAAPRRQVPAEALVAIAGALLTLIGSMLPWVTIFRGTQVLTAWSGTPRYMTALVVAAALLSVLYFRSGRPRSLKTAALVLGLAGFAGIAFEFEQTVSVSSSRSITAQMLDPQAGPGPAVMLVGALMTLAIAHARATNSKLGVSSWARITIALALLGSGWVHLSLTAQHLDESLVLGFGFLFAGCAQLLLAGALLYRPHDLAYYAVVALGVALIVLYAISVIHGLPFGDGQGHDYGLFVVGSGEPVNIEGIVSKMLELLAVALAFVLLGHDASSRPLYRTPAAALE